MEPETAKWLAARRADTAYFLGEYAAAAEHARAVKDEFYDAFAERLDVSESGGGAGAESERRRSLRATPLSLPTPDSAGTSSPSTSTGTPQPTVYDLLARFWKHPLPNPRPTRRRRPTACPTRPSATAPKQAGWVAPRVHPDARRRRAS